MLLNERDWQWWFRVSGAEATRLVQVQRALIVVGLTACPDTVVGMSRTVLGDGGASAKLRALADEWDRAPAPHAEADSGWPAPEEMPHPGQLHRSCWHAQGRVMDELQFQRCRKRRI